MWLIVVLFYIPIIACNGVPYAVWFKIILKFQNQYPPSNIFITHNEGFNDLRVSNTLVSMMKQFSGENIFAIIARITDIPKNINYSYRSKHRQLFVVILKSIGDLITFSRITMGTNLNPYPTLVLFTENTSDFCHNPVGNQFYLNFNSKMLVKCGDSSTIQEWHSIHANTTKVADLFIFNPNFDKFVKLTNLGFYERRNSLDGIGLRVSTKKYNYSMGISADVLDVLSEAANFKLQYQPYEKKGGNFNSETKKWSGVFGRLQEKEADVGYTNVGLSMTIERLETLEFSKVLYVARSKFYIKKLSKTRSMPSMYYKAMGIKAVYCLLATLTGSPIILTVVIARKKQISYKRILYDNYLYVWRIFCINPSPAPSQNLSTKVACLSLLFTAYVLYSVYSTLLVSYLTVLKLDMPFHSLEEFIEAKTHKIIQLKNDSSLQALKASNDNLLKQMKTFLVDWSNTSDPFSQACDRKKRLSLFANDVRFMNLKNNYPCQLISFGSGLVTNKCLAFPKGSPYKGLIDHYVQKMQESGVLNILLKHNRESREIAVSGFKSVSLKSTSPIFGILGIGILLSLLIFICEKSARFVYEIRTEEHSRGKPNFVL